MKKNIILILVLLIISGIYFWSNYMWEVNRKYNNVVKWFSFSKFAFNNIKTDKFEIKNKKILYSWTWEYNTDINKINKFISDLKDIKVKDIASTNKNNFLKFWINVSSSGSSNIAKIDNIDIYLWKNNWYSWEEYIKVKGDDKIYLLNKSLKDILNKDIDFFRKKVEKNKNISLSGSITWTWSK